MPRARSKKDLVEAANEQYDKLVQLVDSLSETELATEFDFSDDPKKTERHWRRDKNLRDIYVHLYEWHRLLLKWIRANQNGDNKPFIPKPYTWKTYGLMNMEFWKKHQDTSLEDAKKMLENSHREVLELADSFSNEELFSKGVFSWAGTNAIGSYFVSVTASHYDWAIKKLKAHKKKIAKG